jgi:hypothetical protein
MEGLWAADRSCIPLDGVFRQQVFAFVGNTLLCFCSEP